MLFPVRPKPGRAPRTLLRVGLVVSAAGAAIAAGGAATASAAPSFTPSFVPSSTPSFVPSSNTDTGAMTTALTGATLKSTGGGLGPVKDLKLNPMANTSVDPLDNGVATQVADFKPMSTKQVTGTLSNGGALRDLPVVGRATRVLPG
ncbi:hypothetical protein [Streptomyces sp. BP-8]|uniref:ATP-binding protein n=1 Tax=Streptomyces sirii TaxID=3127701 RepID=A0ABZ2QRG5_9ACTN